MPCWTRGMSTTLHFGGDICEQAGKAQEEHVPIHAREQMPTLVFDEITGVFDCIDYTFALLYLVSSSMGGWVMLVGIWRLYQRSQV